MGRTLQVGYVKRRCCILSEYLYVLAPRCNSQRVEGMLHIEVREVKDMAQEVKEQDSPRMKVYIQLLRNFFSLRILNV